MSVGSPSSNILVTGNTIRFEANTVKRLVDLRETNPDYLAVIDHYLLDHWARIIKAPDLDKAFREGDEYVIEMALEARKWYDDDSIDVTNGKRNRDKIDGTPPIKLYNFTNKFGDNTYYEVDNLALKFGYTSNLILRRALQQKNGNRIRFFIKNGININQCQGDVSDYFLAETSRDSGKTLKLIVDNLEDIELFVANPDGRTLLMSRAINGDVEMVDYLAAQGANVGAVDVRGKDALLQAPNSADIILRLLELGADVNLVDNSRIRTFALITEKITTLAIRPANQQIEGRIFQLMLDRGAILDTMDFPIVIGPGIRNQIGNVFMYLHRDDLLKRAIEEMQRRNLFLLDNTNPSGNTALAFAYARGVESKIKLLLDNGASPLTAFTILRANATESPTGTNYNERVRREYAGLTKLIQSYGQQ